MIKRKKLGFHMIFNIAYRKYAWIVDLAIMNQILDVSENHREFSELRGCVEGLCKTYD